MTGALELPRPPLARNRRWDELERRPPDVLVVGGGINGAGIALDLVERGLRVALVERDDWAAATSSASSRLIHGGLRYLEQLELGLVRDSCLERGLLLRNAAGLVWPESFVFPLRPGVPPGVLRLAAGLGLYTLVSIPRVLGFPRLLSHASVAARVPGIRSDVSAGGSYLDGATHDARLTLAVVLTAAEHGALCLSRCEALAIEAGQRGVRARLQDRLTGEERTLVARAAVLAAGPFTDALRARAGLPGGWLRPTRGTHVLVPRTRLPTDGAVIFPSGVDGRVMFLIPWPRYTVIGTTDVDASPAEPVRATREEVRYLLDSASELVPQAALGEEDVVASWAGLRPLLADAESQPSERSREERIEREGPIYTIGGGKLTAFRSLAERLGARLADELDLGRKGRRSPTRALRLRGAHASLVPRPAWSALDARGSPRQAGEPVSIAWERRYAALAPALAESCQRSEGGRSALDEETLVGEVDWAVRFEDCLGIEDFLLRRTDLGYGPRAAVEAAAAIVLERLGALLGWSGARATEESARLAQALARIHGWRGVPAPLPQPLP